MPHTFSIALSAGKQPALTFPPVCVGCGAPQACESTLRIERLVMRGQRQTPLRLRYQVPHCDRCARSTRAVFLAGCIPFVLGGLLFGGAAFVWVALGALALGFDEAGQPVNAKSLGSSSCSTPCALRFRALRPANLAPHQAAGCRSPGCVRRI